MKLRIAIAGTRGIPNHYGGFEQITTVLSAGLADRGHEVTVYNSHNHPYREKEYKGVKIIHCYDPEYVLGTAGQFIYDLNCILDARKKSFDVLLFMGYTSSSIWCKLFPREPVVISNMDGFEWKRAKYTPIVRRFLVYAEKLAVHNSDFHIADSKAVQSYLSNEHKVISQYIPYGACCTSGCNEQLLQRWQLEKGSYMLAIARMEPENNLEMIIKGFIASQSNNKLVVVGNTGNRYGGYLKKTYSSGQVIFTGAQFEAETLDSLRGGCSLYFHGHSVGGTNPSLLEAMGAGCFIAAHDNPFNRAVLGEDAWYFDSVETIAGIIAIPPDNRSQEFIDNNREKISREYNWQRIIEAYESFLRSSYNSRKTC